MTVPTGAVVFVTEIFPVAAAAGTVTVSVLAENVAGATGLAPANFTLELALNPIPLIVTVAPAVPDSGEKLKIESVGLKLVALSPVLPPRIALICAGCTPSGTTAFTCVGPTSVTEGDTRPPNLICGFEEKPTPLIVTWLPGRPEPGLKLEMPMQLGKRNVPTRVSQA